MFSRIDVFRIVQEHFGTLRKINSESNRISSADFTLFVLFPLALSFLLAFNDITLDGHISDLITSISIIGGFLFNLLAIVYGLMDKIKEGISSEPITPHQNTNLKQIFVREIHTNISFNILLSLILLFLLIIYSYLINHDSCILGIYRYCYAFFNSVINFFSILIYFLLGLFSLTMLMILNRIYILLKRE